MEGKFSHRSKRVGKQRAKREVHCTSVFQVCVTKQKQKNRFRDLGKKQQLESKRRIANLPKERAIGSAQPRQRTQVRTGASSSSYKSSETMAEIVAPTPPDRVLSSRMATCRAFTLVNLFMFRAQYVCVCFLPIYSGSQVRWMHSPGSHRRKVTQDLSSIFLLRCMP